MEILDVIHRFKYVNTSFNPTSKTTQTLSQSVGDALWFCEEKLKLPETSRALATAKYCKIFDHRFRQTYFHDELISIIQKYFKPYHHEHSKSCGEKNFSPLKS